jgi:hypothetical protein
MRFPGRLRRRKEGVGSIIGAVFIVLILLSGLTFYATYLGITDRYNGTIASMGDLGWNQNQERIVIKQVTITATNNLNLTVENQGAVQSHLIWLGLFNKSAVPENQGYYALNEHLNPSEKQNIVSNFTVVEGLKYAVQLVTELGNIVQNVFYPASDVRCALSLTAASPTTYEGNNVTVMLTVTHNDTEVNAIQSLTAGISVTPSALVQLVENSPLTVAGLARGESAFFWWVYNTNGTGTVTFNATYSSAPAGTYALTNVNVLASPGQGGGGSVSISGLNGTAEYNPSNWTLLGATQYVSGSVADLTSNDSSYAVFRSYYAGTSTDINHFVDDNSSNVDGSPNLGTHGNFTAQQYGPDLINDTLTEADVPIISGDTQQFVQSNNSQYDTDIGGTSNFPAEQSADNICDTLTEANTNAASSSFGNPTQSGTNYVSISASNMYGQNFTSPSYASTLNSMTFYGRFSGYIGSHNVKAVLVLASTHSIVTNGISSPVSIGTSPTWNTATFSPAPSISANTNYILMIIPDTSSFRLYYTSTMGGSEYYDTTNSYSSPSNPTEAYTGYHQYSIYANCTLTPNYQLDLERQWTTAPYANSSELLCIKTGTFSDSEALEVDVWNGAWTVLNNSLAANSWNNMSVTAYLTSASFAIRFIDTTTGDPTQSTWQIDAVLLHTWNSTDNHQLDIEERFTSVDTGAYTNKELCIFAGTGSTSETLKVDVWNTTSSSWVTVIASLTKNQWNNVSIANLLTATVTIRFHDGAETNDTVQDSWNIDVVLLHAWSEEYTSEVALTGSSNSQAWTSLLWQIQSCWNIDQVTVTIQFYNFTLGNYISSGTGYVSYVSDAIPNTNELWFQTELLSPNDFKNSTGHWRVKITGVKSTSTPFLMKIDWIDLQTTYSTTNDTILYNAWQLYSIKATTTSGGPIPYACVTIYANGTNIVFRNATDKTPVGNPTPTGVRLDKSGIIQLEVKSTSGSSETFVLYAVVGSLVGQKTVTQEAP